MPQTFCFDLLCGNICAEILAILHKSFITLSISLKVILNYSINLQIIGFHGPWQTVLICLEFDTYSSMIFREWTICFNHAVYFTYFDFAVERAGAQMQNFFRGVCVQGPSFFHEGPTFHGLIALKASPAYVLYEDPLTIEIYRIGGWLKYNARYRQPMGFKAPPKENILATHFLGCRKIHLS